MSISREQILKDFPQLTQATNGEVITYLDSGATTLKTKSVIDLVETYYAKECANIHRGIHTLSEISTDKYEATRDKLQDFINANKREEIIFTKGTTESINLVAKSWGTANLKQDDEILISYMEHHSNIVPWQILCEQTGAKLKVIPIDDNGDILIEEYKALLNEKTKLVSVAYISNALGTVNPIKEMIELAHAKNALFLVDAAQASAHKKIDVKDLDCDFLAFSGHKMYGPTGVGILYGKEDILNAMPPFLGGGDMIDVVSFEKTTYNTLPHKFEAGTPNIASVIGLGAAVDYITNIGHENIFNYMSELLAYAEKEILKVQGLRIIGTPKVRSGVISFYIDGIHPHDLATIMNKYHVAIRTGHHCTQPLMKRMNVPATARASFSIYNTKEDVDRLVVSLKKIVDLFL